MFIQGLQLEFNDQLSFTEIVEKLDQGGTGFVLIVNQQKQLIGIVTDGDVRKAVLTKNYNANAIINFTPHFKFEKDKESSYLYMRLNKIRHLPIVDENRIVKEVCLQGDVEYLKTNVPVVLMAGGLGSRLMPLTEKTPKPMLLMSGKPILHCLIEQLKSYGFYSFYISVNYLADTIKDYFGDGSKFGVSINYIQEKQRLGTAGALYYLKNKINTTFLVMNSDLITELNFKQFLEAHEQNRADCSICTKKQIYRVPFGVIESDETNNVLAIREKPVFTYDVNAGIYLFEPTVLKLVNEESFLDMNELIERIQNTTGKMIKFSIKEFWSDIGTIEEYNKIVNSTNKSS
jgi:dTDP-glucose pyrophosphorylase